MHRKINVSTCCSSVSRLLLTVELIHRSFLSTMCTTCSSLPACWFPHLVDGQPYPPGPHSSTLGPIELLYHVRNSSLESSIFPKPYSPVYTDHSPFSLLTPLKTMTSENLPLVVAQTESRKDIVNAAVRSVGSRSRLNVVNVLMSDYSDAVNSWVPNSSQMQPGRVYVGRLPSHAGPVFVRRRRRSFANPFGVPSVTSLWAPPPPPPMEYQCATTTIYQPQPQPSMIVAQQPTYAAPPQVVQPPAYLGLPPPPPPIGTTTTTTTTHEVQPPPAPTKHTCAACGKFRSPRYHYRHPLAPGETPRPTLCRKCVRQHTSSEEFEEIERARKKRRGHEARQRPRHESYSSEDWVSSSSQDERRKHHRFSSSNESRRRRRSPRSSSGVSNRIFIIRRPAERRQPRSSSESVRIVRRVRSTEDRLAPFPGSRYRYGPFDGHHSYEDYHSDEHETDDFGHRGRSRSRSISRRSHEDSHSFEDDYVRISTSVSRRKPLSLLDRLSRSRSRSSSRSRWRRNRPEHYDEEITRITIRSREPSPVRYERHEEEYEERIEGPPRSLWRRGSSSMTVQRDATTLETHSDGYFDRHRRSPTRSMRIMRARSPSILRRRSLDHGMQDRRRVRFARSDESGEEYHAGTCFVPAIRLL